MLLHFHWTLIVLVLNFLYWVVFLVMSRIHKKVHVNGLNGNFAYELLTKTCLSFINLFQSRFNFFLLQTLYIMYVFPEEHYISFVFILFKITTDWIWLSTSRTISSIRRTQAHHETSRAKFSNLYIKIGSHQQKFCVKPDNVFRIDLGRIYKYSLEMLIIST